MEDRINLGNADDAIRQASRALCQGHGLDQLPSTSFEINQAWGVAAMIACDLLCRLRLLCLDDPLARVEPKTLRYRLLHTAVRLVRRHAN